MKISNKITVIIPVYNSMLFLDDCIKSVLDTSINMELILVDDGSTDDSALICKKYEKNDPRVKYIYKTNGGVSSARNCGIKHSTGDYIMFVDSDDLLESGWGDVEQIIDGKSDIYYLTDKIDNGMAKKELLKCLVGCGADNICIASVWGKLFKASFIKNNKVLFDEKIINGEDMLFNIRALLLTESYRIADFGYYKYRQSNSQSTRRFDERIINSDILFHKQLDKILKNANVKRELAESLKAECLKNAVLLVANKIASVGSFSKSKAFYSIMENEPYLSAIKNNANKGLLFDLLKKKKYRIVYFVMKVKNILIGLRLKMAPGRFK